MKFKPGVIPIDASSGKVKSDLRILIFYLTKSRCASPTSPNRFLFLRKNIRHFRIHFLERQLTADALQFHNLVEILVLAV